MESKIKMWNTLKKAAEKAVITFSIIFSVLFFTFLFLTDHAFSALLLLAILIYNTFKKNY